MIDHKQELAESFIQRQTGSAKDQWALLLYVMLNEFRKMHPDDPRSDDALLDVFMERFVADGLAKKENGKFLVPRIIP